MSGTEPSCVKVDAGTAIRLSRIGFYHQTREILRDISFEVPSGTFLTLLGPSGCGKTTLLKLLGGYLTPSSGEISLGDREMKGVPPEARQIGMVFQNYALFPHLSAWDNVAFPLEVRRVPRKEVSLRVDSMMRRVGLTADDFYRKPDRLSGGQQQRVAIARALIFNPELVLLDEPFANLDRRLREQMRSELRRLHLESRTTFVMVTHDQEEAMAVSDLLGVMSAGKLLQMGPPAELYRKPRTPFVARFLGEGNLLPSVMFGIDGERLVLVRPEDISVGDSVSQSPHSWDGIVEEIAFHGADRTAVIRCGSIRLAVRTRQNRELTVRQTVRVTIPPESLWVIPDSDEV